MKDVKTDVEKRESGKRCAIGRGEVNMFQSADYVNKARSLLVTSFLEPTCSTIAHGLEGDHIRSSLQIDIIAISPHILSARRILSSP